MGWVRLVVGHEDGSSMTATSIPLQRWIWLPFVFIAAMYYAAPRLLKRAFAPPQRDATQTPGDFGLPEEQVWLDSVNGTRLHGWFVPVDGPAPAVVVLHGWGGNAALMLPLAPHLHRARYHVLLLDARNHGLSEHDRFTSMPRFAEDLEVAVDWLRAHPAVTSVGVIGHSVGAGAAILSASHGGELEAVVSVSAPAHPGELMRVQMASIPGPFLELILGAVQKTIGQRFDEFAPRNRIAHVDIPLLLIHGASDQVVPVSNLHELSAANRKAATLVVPNGGHSDLAPFEAHIDEIIAFLDRYLQSAAQILQTRDSRTINPQR